MAYLAPISPSLSIFKNPQLTRFESSPNPLFSRPRFQSIGMPMNKASSSVVIRAMAAAENQKKRYPGESKGFVEDIMFVSEGLIKELEKKTKSPEERPVAKREPTVEGYLRFLVDSKLVYDTLERIIDEAPYAEFKKTGFERAEKLGIDLEWFKEQGYEIPKPTAAGKRYSVYLKYLAENDPQAFICHYFFVHISAIRKIGLEEAEKILDNKELEFYKWDGEVSKLLQNTREQLNKVAEEWTREEKNRFLKETLKWATYSVSILIHLRC